MKICRALLIASVLLMGWLIFRAVPGWMLIGVGLLVVARKGYTQLSAFGTARWAGLDDLRKAGMLGGNGMILGRMIAPPPPVIPSILGLFDPCMKAEAACRQFLGSLRRFNRRKDSAQPLVRLNAVHAAVFAPTGVGKGVSCVIPHLLSCPDSTVVVDPKGENAKLTADARRKMGHKVVILDPFNIVGGTDTFNPLDFIDRNSPLALDDCRDMANALVVRTGNEHEPFWLDAAEGWITAMIATVVFHGEANDRSLQTLRPLLTNPAKMAAVIELMCASDAAGGMLSRLGFQLTQSKDKELNSTLTTTNRHLRFLDTVAIATSTKKSTFDPAELRTGKMTVYLVLPPEHMRAQSALLRMWIGSMLRAVVRGGLQEATKVHFVLDEAASLGHLEAIDDAVAVMRGYGLRLIFLYQSLGQLKSCFPDGETVLLGNCSQVFFGVNDQQTAEYVSKRLGVETIVVESSGRNDGRSVSGEPNSGSRSSGSSRNWALQKRELLLPEEVTALDPRIAITFTPGVPPLWTRLVRYYEGFQESAFQRLRGKAEIVLGSILLFGLMVGLAVKVIQKGGVSWGH